MGIFDRLASKLEQDNTQAVYESALRELDAKIAAHTERLASLRVEQRTRAARGDDSDRGYDALVEQAEQLLTEMRTARRKLEQERLSAPAAKAVAEASVQLADDASGLGERSSSQALASVRDQVEALNRRASPGELDADGIPIHGRRAALDRKAKEDRAREELERLKRELKGD